MRNTAFRKVKQLLCLILAVMSVFVLAVPVFAETTTGVAEDVAASTSDGEEKTYTDAEIQYGLDKEENQINLDELEVVTTDDVNNWVDKKGNEVVSIIQRGARIVSIIGFFICLILVAIGAFGNHKTMFGGLIGAIIAAVCYVAITYGKELLNLFSSWLMS